MARATFARTGSVTLFTSSRDIWSAGRLMLRDPLGSEADYIDDYRYLSQRVERVSLNRTPGPGVGQRPGRLAGKRNDRKATRGDCHPASLDRTPEPANGAC